MNWALTAASFGIGIVVGLTGMGGGALMTPVLVIFFHIQPLAAVSSDLVASLFMKPLGGGLHWRRGTVRRDLVLWLSIGSVPAAFTGVLLLRALGAANVQDLLKRALGLALIASASAIVLRARIQRRRDRGVEPGPAVLNRPLTLAIGAVGGLIVGMTSVGSGSLIIVMLLFLYPGLTSAELVGTDLVQAIPLVAAAALGHLLFGAVKLGLTASLLAGALPGVYVGAHLSSRTSQRVVRPALFLVLLTSGLKLVQVI